MRLKVPPVAVLAVAALLLVAFHLLLPSLTITFAGQSFLALVFVVVGLVPGLQAVRSFRATKTTVNPMKPDEATKLVTSGVYRYTRNPMYVGLLCLLIAIALFLGTLSALVILPAFVWYMTEFQIKPEEDSLRLIFGAEYADYTSHVRRWV
ncbi:isoprenylcysteine carboxylmethyltransferase family protein [Rhodobacterales bacterium]|nr:isoprenylcysteine carboxylmethyltransferase family protein [Rhodobacterales bacterium]